MITRMFYLTHKLNSIMSLYLFLHSLSELTAVTNRRFYILSTFLSLTYDHFGLERKKQKA